MGRPEPDLADDVLLDLFRGRGGEGGNGDVRKELWNSGKSEVVGPEIVAPLGDAVRLVDGEEREGDALERLDELRHGKAFRRDVEELDLIGFEPAVDVRYFPLVKRAVHEHGRNAVFLRRVDLVLHERDEGADDDRCSLQQKRRQLVAQGLAPARGHDREDVLPVQDVIDNGLLVRPEGRKTEDRAENIMNRRIL